MLSFKNKSNSMLKSFYIISLSFVFAKTIFGQTTKNEITISGYAPAYIGKTIDVYRIEDYLTLNEELIASTIVNKDSTFNLNLNVTTTQKIILKSNKNKAYLYVQPNANYEVLFPEKDKYDPFRPSGNTVELTFASLDSNDINYKILGFNRWTDDFIGNYYYSKNSKPIEFAKELDTFKLYAEKAYSKDTSTYFKTFVKFTFAALDEIQSIGTRNKYEKHDFYLKHSPVYYDNDAYMQYLTKFYENQMPRFNTETASKVNLAIEKSSPTLLMKALGGEYTLINLRIREIAMIKLLSEEYYKGEGYQRNILNILDSLSAHSMFKNDQIIAKNTIARLEELVPGSKSPEFSLTGINGQTKTINSYNGKHVYLHFFNPMSENCVNELQVLQKLNESYKNDVTFITIYPHNDSYSAENKKILDGINWEKFEVKENDPILKKFDVENFPYYVLIDQIGYVVAAPALGPQPNGQYETIEKTFYFIHDFNMKKN